MLKVSSVISNYEIQNAYRTVVKTRLDRVMSGAQVWLLLHCRSAPSLELVVNREGVIYVEYVVFVAQMTRRVVERDTRETSRKRSCVLEQISHQ